MFKELSRDKERKDRSKNIGLKTQNTKAGNTSIRQQRNGRIESSSSKGDQKRNSNVTDSVSNRKKTKRMLDSIEDDVIEEVINSRKSILGQGRGSLI